MDEQSARGGVSDRHAKASPWPLFVAVGLALSEVGVVFNFLPVALAGIALFGGSVVGVVRESGYAGTLWRPTAVVGALFAAAGGAVYLGSTFDFRGAYVGGAGVLFLAAAVVLALAETGRV